MTLTDELRQYDSAANIFLQGISPLFRDLKGSSKSASAASRALGFTDALSTKPRVCLDPSLSAREWSSVIGTAFDYRTRILLGSFDLYDSEAVRGLSYLTSAGSSEESRILNEAFYIARKLLAGDDPVGRDKAAVVLAWGEGFVRAPPGVILAGSFGDRLRGADSGEALLESIPEEVLTDLQGLRTVGQAGQIEQWAASIGRGEHFIPNPTFSGSAVLGGADADWIVGDTLIECKSTGLLDKSKLQKALFQVLAYVLLDKNDDFAIREVAVWLPRYGILPTWKLSDLLGADPEQALPSLRRNFLRVVGSHKAVATPLSLTEKKAQYLLAENIMSPVEKLSELAASEVVLTRVKVAGNPSTPSAVLCLLAQDGRAEVRAAAAGNPGIPTESLADLREDRIERVREAAHREPLQLTAKIGAPDIVQRPGTREPIPDGWAMYWLENTKFATYGDYCWVLYLPFSQAIKPESFIPRAWSERRDQEGTAEAAAKRETEHLDRIYDPDKWAMHDAWEQESEAARQEEAASEKPPAVPSPAAIPGRHVMVLSPEEKLADVLRDRSASIEKRLTALSTLASSENVSARKDAARSDLLDERLALRLATDSRAEVRQLVASNRKAPVPALEFLSGAKTWSVRIIAAANPSLPSKTLRRLSTDSDFAGLKLSLAWNPSTPSDLLELLSVEPDLAICLITILNPGIPLETVRSLTEDQDPIVAKVAVATLAYRMSPEGAVVVSSEVADAESTEEQPPG